MANSPATMSLIATPTLVGWPPSASASPVMDISPPTAWITKSYPGRSAAGRRVRTADGEVDEVGVEVAQGLLVESQPRQRSRSEVVDEDVRVSQQAAQDVRAGPLPDIQSHRPLVSVDREVVGGGPRSGRFVPHPWRSPAAGRVPSGGSTLTTSAPRSARSIVAYGPASTVERSMTRSPASGPVGGGDAWGMAPMVAPGRTSDGCREPSRRTSRPGPRRVGPRSSGRTDRGPRSRHPGPA